MPPSTTSDAPVMYDDEGPARKSTTAAISRASPVRPSGTPGRGLSRGSSSVCPVIGVEISPGATELTVIPCSASSIAMTLVSAPSPAFAAQ